MLTDRQLEIVTGSLLGDGTICTNFVDPNCKFQLTQSKSDKDGISKKTYFFWFVKEFIDLGCTVAPKAIKSSGILYKNKIYFQYVFNTRCNHLWNEIEKKWYVPRVDHHFFRRRKIVPLDLKLTPLILCVWMMEDGSNYSKDGNITLETQGFTPQEVDFLIARLDIDLGIKATKKKTKKKNQFRIFVGVKFQKKLIDIIKPHVEWDCFQYKLDDNYNKIHQSGANHSQSKLTEDQALKMISLRRFGKSISDLAKEFKTSKANVSLITSGERWKHLDNPINVIKKKRLTKEQKEQIVVLFNNGMHQKEIAKIFDSHQSTICRFLQKHKKIKEKFK